MFDIGFWELILIAIVALIVIGPERLPRVARTAGLYMGRARRMVATVKADVQRELATEELKRTLEKQADSVGLHEIVEEVDQATAAAREFFSPEAQAARDAEEAAAIEDTATVEDTAVTGGTAATELTDQASPKQHGKI